MRPLKAIIFNGVSVYIFARMSPVIPEADTNNSLG